MISKPLFKQSCKANAGIWTFVTAITCFMLAIIIFVLGNLNASSIRTSMTDMFVSDAIESEIEKQSMIYYSLTSNALTSYVEKNNDLKNLLQNQMSQESKQGIIDNYNALIANGLTKQQAKETIVASVDESLKVATLTLLEYYDVCGQDYSDLQISKYVLNAVAENIYSELYELRGKETADNASTFIKSAINTYTQNLEANPLLSVEEFATAYIPQVLTGVFYEQSFVYESDTFYIKTYFSQEQIETKSYTSIVSFRAQMEVKKDQIISQNPDYTEQQVQEKMNEYKDELILDMSKTLVEELPQKVFDALGEIRGLDVYGLVIGSIFFRIAGLLLPMIFVIMTANNLVAGQVDSGSMAYVLSTPTKRKTVMFTQILYLISSLFVMFLATTITSVVCLAIVNSSEITITYSQLLLLNLGAFITMVAISGICFLASSWFNRSKLSMSCGGGLTMFFLVATILGLFGSKVIPSAIRIDAMQYFNYVSIISLFDAISILESTTTFIWKFAILLAIGLITYTISVFKFDKKDLPL